MTTYHTRTAHGHTWHLRIQGQVQSLLIHRGKSGWTKNKELPGEPKPVYLAEWKESTEQAFNEALTKHEAARKVAACKPTVRA